MSNSDTALADLRQKIDQIDDQLHDLVMARAALVDEIRKHKDLSGKAMIQPARETAMLRRLAARHKGAFPFAAILRIWREIMSAGPHAQPLAVAVHAPDDLPGPWDLARDHFGSTVPIQAYGSVSQVIRAVTERTAAVGILPMPLEQEPDPWWRHLLSVDATAPRIFARLPAGARGNARGTGTVLAIAGNLSDFTSVDHSLLAFETPHPVSRSKLTGALKAAQLEVNLLAIHGRDGGHWICAEITGPVAADDARLEELRAQLGIAINAVYHLGGYADPVLPPHA